MEKKWTVFICCSVITFCQDYFNDLPSTISRRLQGTSDDCKSDENDSNHDRCLNLSYMEYNSFSTATTWAAAVAAVVSALTIGRYKDRYTMWTATSLMLAGAILFAGGSYSYTSGAYPILLVGRIIFGFGNGASAVLDNHLMNQWWDSSAFSISWYILAGRLGSGANYLINGSAVKAIGMRGCMWIAVIVVAFTIIAGHYLGHIGEKEKSTPPSEKEGLMNFFTKVDRVFWAFAFVYFLIHAVEQTYTSNAAQLLGEREDYSENYATYVVGIVQYMGIIMPLVGYFVDRTGRRHWWILAGTLFMALAFTLYVAQSDKGHVRGLSFFLGLGYNLADPVISSSTSVVSPKGTAGIANAALKFFRYVAVGAVTTAAGEILDQVDEKAHTEWKHFTVFMLIFAAIAAFFAILLVYFERRSRKHALTITQKQRMEQEDGDEPSETESLTSGNWLTKKWYSIKEAI